MINESNKEIQKGELETLLSQISPEKLDENPNFYQAYGVLDEMKFNREELRAAFKVLYALVMNMTKEERDNNYLFDNGLITAKVKFMDAKSHESEFDDAQKKAFEQAQTKFRGKLEKLKPAVDFLIRLKEIL